MPFFKKILPLSALALCISIAAHAGELEEKGREVLAKYKGTVVTVQLVIKQQMSFGGQSHDEEMKTEALGTVISPDGLTVLALSATDPMSVLKNMMGNMASQFEGTTQLADINILMLDDTEIPAKVVLRDKDLDLAFILPTEKPATPMEYVDLADSGDVQTLDQVVAITRMGKVVQRVHSASFERIEAIVEKPRKFYVPGGDPTNTGQGSPAFTLDGKIVGIFVIRSVPSDGSMGGMMGALGGGATNVAPILLPASDIAEGASQAVALDDAPAE